MFVKQFSSLLCRRVLKMHKGAEFSRLQRVLNFFLKRATGQNAALVTVQKLLGALLEYRKFKN